MSDSKVNEAAGAFQAAADQATKNAEDMLGMDPAKMSETLRAMAQKSMEQSKEAYSRMKAVSDDATRSLESAMENAHQGSLSLSKKAIEAMRSNAEMGFAHLERMMSATSFAEVIEMQTGYVRRQIEAATDQARDMQALSQSIAQDMMKPGRDAFRKPGDTVKGN